VLRVLHTNETSFDELLRFFIERFKKDSLIVGKRNTVIVFPRKYSGGYTVGIGIARCLRKTHAVKVLA
jgi:hypothetical protein